MFSQATDIQSAGSNLDRAAGGGRNALVALRRQRGERLDPAAANFVLAGDVNVRRGSANFLDGLSQPMIERLLSSLTRQVEIGGLNGRASNYRLGKSRRRGEGQQSGEENLGHVTSPFRWGRINRRDIHLCP